MSLYNLARVSTATTGTGTITLGSAVTSFLTFAQAGVQDGDVVTYAIEDANGGREIGSGTYTASGTTLTRDKVYRSTGTGNTGKITLSGSAQVVVLAAAEDLYKPERKNYIRNNAMRGAANPSTLPTNWQNISSPGGVSTTINVGVEFGMEYIEFAISGTTTNTNAWVRGFEGSTVIASSVGAVENTSAFVKIVGGDLTNINYIRFRNSEMDSGGSILQNGVGTDFSASIPTSGSPKRFSATRTMANASTAFVRPALDIGTNGSGLAINLTIRIYRPQHEKLPDASFYESEAIRTVDAAIARLNTGLLEPFTPQQSYHVTDLVASVTDLTGSTGTGNLVLSAGPILTGIIKLEGSTASFPGFQRDGTTVKIVLADGSGYGRVDSDTVLDRGADPTGTPGTGYVRKTSPSLESPNLGTPSAVVLTNGIGLPLSGLSGLGTNVETFLGTPSSANLAAALTDESGSGNIVFTISPTLVTPNLGTPSAVTLTNGTGLPISTGVSGLAAGIATFLGTPSSANLAAALTDESGSGSVVFGTSPTITTPDIVGTATNNNAAAGSVGEYQSAVATAVALTSPNVLNVVSLSLTAGDWDVEGTVKFNFAATTTSTVRAAGITATSGTMPTTLADNTAWVRDTGAITAGQAPYVMNTGVARISLASTTTVYLVGGATFATSTATVDGMIKARRVR